MIWCWCPLLVFFNFMFINIFWKSIFSIYSFLGIQPMVGFISPYVEYRILNLWNFIKPYHKFQPNAQIYVRRIFVEHSYNIFPEHLEKVPHEIPGNIGYRNIPWMFHEYPTNVTCISLSGTRNTIAVFPSG